MHLSYNSFITFTHQQHSNTTTIMSQVITAYGADEAFRFVMNEINQRGQFVQSRDGDKRSTVKELTNVTVTIINPLQRRIYAPERKWSMKCACAEFAWYMTVNPKVEIVAKYIKNWKNFSDDGKTVNSQYGAIWHHQVKQVIQRLREDPLSRRAVISIYDKSYADYNGKDMPCTCNLMFQIRHGALHMTTVMRSNDAVWGFCNDVFAFTCLQELIANELKCKLGQYNHFAASLHVYERHFDMLRDVKTIKNPDDKVYFDPNGIQTSTTYSNFWDAADPYFFEHVDVDWFYKYLEKERLFTKEEIESMEAQQE